MRMLWGGPPPPPPARGARLPGRERRTGRRPGEARARGGRRALPGESAAPPRMAATSSPRVRDDTNLDPVDERRPRPRWPAERSPPSPDVRAHRGAAEGRPGPAARFPRARARRSRGRRRAVSPRGASPSAQRTAAAMARSKPVPVLRRSAGARLTTMPHSPMWMPSSRSALFTRTRLSRTDASASPTRSKNGGPRNAATSTRTRCASRPTSVALRVVASMCPNENREPRAPRHPREFTAYVRSPTGARVSLADRGHPLPLDRVDVRHAGVSRRVRREELNADLERWRDERGGDIADGDRRPAAPDQRCPSST